MKNSRPVAIAFSQFELAERVKRCLIASGIPKDDIERTRLRDTKEVKSWLRGKNAKLIIVDAELATVPTGRDDSGQTVLALLRERSRPLVPAMVITTIRNPASELEQYCTPGNEAIALSRNNLFPDRFEVFKGVLGMIVRDPKTPPTWTVLEILVRDRVCKCSLGNGTKATVDWDKLTAISSIRATAMAYEEPGVFKPPSWLRHLKIAGRDLFNTYVYGALGKEMFEHIERSAGGLSKLAFRFQISETALYAAPFEASVRPIDDDPEKSEFVLVHAPVTRWMPTADIIKTGSPRSAQLPSCIKVLFIRSQMGEHPSGETRADTLNVGNGEIRQFRKLDNIDLERERLLKLEKDYPGKIVVRLLDLRGHDADAASKEVRKNLNEGGFDIVHFAGHSWSSSVGPSARTFLVLPGTERGKATKMPIESFAEITGEFDVRLVYLSSCQGSSARSVLSLVRNGVLHALGFRCDVEDDKAAKFAGDFYDHLLAGGSICSAFRYACAESHNALDEEGLSPIWASPILVAQTEDWAAQH